MFLIGTSFPDTQCQRAPLSFSLSQERLDSRKKRMAPLLDTHNVVSCMAPLLGSLRYSVYLRAKHKNRPHA